MAQHRCEVHPDVNSGKYFWVCVCGQSCPPIYASEADVEAAWEAHVRMSRETS